MRRDRSGRLPWAIVLLVIVLSCSIAYGGARLIHRLSPSNALHKVEMLQLNSIQGLEAVSDGLVYYDGSSLSKIRSNSKSAWSYMPGAGAEFSASDAGVATWIGRTLTLIDGESGVPSYSGNMEEDVLSAHMGDIYTAVLLGPEHNSTIVLMENGGRKVDSITLPEQTVIDYGFFYNDTLFWVMTLDTNGTVPSCTVSTYRPGRRIVGSITDTEQLLYRAMFQSTQIACAGDTFLKVYDYNGKEVREKRQLIYGWTLADAEDSDLNPMMAFVPNMQYDGSLSMQDVRMIRGTNSQIVHMPFECKSIVAKGQNVYGFSGEGYMMVAQMGSQKVDAFNMNLQFDRVYGVADGNIAILGSGNLIYFVSMG